MTLLYILISLNILAVCVVGFVLCDILQEVKKLCFSAD